MAFLRCFILVLCIGCIKDPGKLPTSNLNSNSGTTSGGSSGGSTVVLIDDPLASYAWHLKNTGQSSFSTSVGTAGEDINLESIVLQGARGRGVRVAVSDTGVQTTHPDLAANELPNEHRNYSFASPLSWRNVASPIPSGGEAHGTAVTGLIAALGWNGIGSRGIAPEAKYAGFSFVVTYPATVTSLTTRAIDQTDGDFDIFNYSYGYGGCQFFQPDALINEAIEDGVTNLRDGKGAIYVQSAGNSYLSSLDNCMGMVLGGFNFYGNTNVTSDLASPHKIVVGAVNALGLVSSYSTPGSGLWVSAPGGEFGTTSPAMVTTDITSCNFGMSIKNTILNDFNAGRSSLNSTCDYTSKMNGTSSAAPVTSGVVALMLEANPNLSWRDVKHILAMTSEQIDIVEPFNITNKLFHPEGFDLPLYDYDEKWVINAAGMRFSNVYGFGRLDATRAVQAAKIYHSTLGTYEKTMNPNSGTWYYDSGALSLPIPDEDYNGVTHSLMVSHNFIVEAVQIQLTTDHDLPADLAVHLSSPNGVMESRLLRINSNIFSATMPANKLLLTNAFYGEESYGNWTIRLVDGNGGSVGNLQNWKILIHGHKVDLDGSNPSAPSGLANAPTSNSAITAPSCTFTGSSAVDFSRYEVSAGTAPGLDNISTWESIGSATTFQLRNLNLPRARTYYLNVRAVDQRENASSIVSSPWYVSL